MMEIYIFIKNFLSLMHDYIGYIGSIVLVLGIVATVWGTFNGFIPVLLRLGRGLWNRQIAVIATGGNLNKLVKLLEETQLFRVKNIIRIDGESELEGASDASVLLVHWADCSEFIDEILSHKTKNDPLIIYAPNKDGRIPDDVLEKLEKKKHVVINNFRGRLLNDIVTSMMTTAYEKK